MSLEKYRKPRLIDKIKAQEVVQPKKSNRKTTVKIAVKKVAKKKK